MGQFTHHRLERLQMVSAGSLQNQSTTQFLRWRTKNKRGYAFRTVIILRSNHENAIRPNIRGHACGGPPYLDMRVPEWHSCENLAGYR